MTGRVCVIGSLNIDITTHVHTHPTPGETVSGTDLVYAPGGKGANQALAAARAGVIVSLVGRVGDDERSAEYLGGLTERGVDCSHVHVTSHTPTGHALITVDQRGENSIVVTPGANHAVTPADIDAAAPLLRQADVVLLQLELPVPAVTAAVHAATAAGVRIVLNASPWTALPRALLTLPDPVLVNEHETARLPAGLPSVCITRGAAGAHWGDMTVPAPAITPIDTTGAGDTFAGVLAAGLAAGDAPLVALRHATQAAAQACTRVGAQDWRLSAIATQQMPAR